MTTTQQSQPQPEQTTDDRCYAATGPNGYQCRGETVVIHGTSYGVPWQLSACQTHAI